MATLLMVFPFLAMLGCLVGRIIGPVLKVCPYRLGAILAAAVPAVGGLTTMAFMPEERALQLALTGVLSGMGACTGVFLTGHRSIPLACLGAIAGGAAGTALGAML